MRVASPRQGDFAEPDRGFKGEGPALARLSHRCDTVGQRTCRNSVPDGVAAPVRFSCDLREWRDVEPQCTAARVAGFTVPRTCGERARRRASPVNAEMADLPGKR